MILEMSMPSILIAPDCGSRNLNSASVKLDLPAPVLPTTPTLSLALTENVRFFNTGGRSFA